MRESDYPIDALSNDWKSADSNARLARLHAAYVRTRDINGVPISVCVVTSDDQSTKPTLVTVYWGDDELRVECRCLECHTHIPCGHAAVALIRMGILIVEDADTSFADELTSVPLLGE